MDTSEIVNTVLLFLRSCFAGEDMFGPPLASEALNEDVASKVSSMSTVYVIHTLFPCMQHSSVVIQKSRNQKY